MSKVLLVMIGGGLGASSRYGATLLAVRFLGSSYPWGTLFANLVGCFLIGICFALAEFKGMLSPDLRLFFVTGFLGGLTTFSTYAMESVSFARSGSLSMTLLNISAHNLAGLALVLIGMALVRTLLP
jgi:fluoride exporter